MKTDTKFFGEIDYEEDQVISFPKGVYGFEDEHRFLLLPFSGNRTLFALQSLDTPELAFVLIDPFSLLPEYSPVLQPEELRELEAEDSRELYYYTMCVVREPVGESTVNLQCPVAINGDAYKAMQVILEGGDYQMRHRLSELGAAEGDESC